MNVNKVKEQLIIAETKCLCTDDRLQPLENIQKALAELEQPIIKGCSYFDGLVCHALFEDGSECNVKNCPELKKQPEPPALSEVEGGEFTKKYTEKEILLSYEGRCICDKQELGGGYCGSCSIEIHREQLNNPKSWVHSSVQHWLEAVNPKPTYEQLQAEIDRLEARNRVKQGLLEVTENMLSKERAENKRQAERIEKLEKELKNNKPQIEDDMC